MTFPNFPATTVNIARAKAATFGPVSSVPVRSEWLDREVAGWDAIDITHGSWVASMTIRHRKNPTIGQTAMDEVVRQKTLLNNQKRLFLIENPDVSFEIMDAPGHEIVLLNDEDTMLFNLGWRQ